MGVELGEMPASRIGGKSDACKTIEEAGAMTDRDD
jgi:hypothetical protein